MPKRVVSEADKGANASVLRAVIIWFLIILAESINGTIRTIFFVPVVGEMRARQAGVFVGMAVIFVITFLSIRWVRVRGTPSLLIVGSIWIALTVAFEFALGMLILGYNSERLFEDYDPTRGGLMLIGLAFMLFSPLLAARLRGVG